MSGQRDPLEGCRARVQRAKEHLQDLHSEVVAFRELNPYGVASYANPATEEYVHLARVSQEPPVQWGVVAGEIVHHLRAALDNLAWQLVLDNGNTPKTGSRGTIFPIFNDPHKFKSSGRTKVEGASEDVITSIENIQPYQRRDRRTGQLLLLLHELDIRDKHQVLNLAVGTIRSGSITYTDPVENTDIFEFTVGDPGTIIPLKDGTILGRDPIPEGGLEVNMRAQFTFDIAFDQSGPAQNKPLVPTLSNLIELVDQMITWFRPLFRQDAS